MWLKIINMLLPLAFTILKTYIKSTETKRDDKVLEIAKEASGYIVKNSSIDTDISELVPVASKVIESYLSKKLSSKDGVILNTLKSSSKSLSLKGNNTLRYDTFKLISRAEMT